MEIIGSGIVGMLIVLCVVTLCICLCRALLKESDLAGFWLVGCVTLFLVSAGIFYLPIKRSTEIFTASSVVRTPRTLIVEYVDDGERKILTSSDIGLYNSSNHVARVKKEFSLGGVFMDEYSAEIEGD